MKKSRAFRNAKGFFIDSLLFFIICAITFSLARCQKRSSAGSIRFSNLKVGFVYIGSINDNGFNSSIDAGRKALEEMGIACLYEENVPETAECESKIRSLIDKGCNVIYANSFGYMDWVFRLAIEYPSVKFCHFSGYMHTENLSTFFGRMYEVRYLTGIVAGLNSNSGKIGYVAASSISECIRGINAFTLGVRSVNPNATVNVRFLNSWYDPDGAKAAVDDLDSIGCDVVTFHENSTATIKEAEKKGMYVIGYNTSAASMAPTVYLTGALFHWEEYFPKDVEDVLNGNWKSRSFWGGIKSKVVDIDTITELCVPETKDKVTRAKNDIISGDLEIFQGPIRDQNGKEIVHKGKKLSDEQIWNMDYFLEGVVGQIPAH